jgi:hypothetical protein
METFLFRDVGLADFRVAARGAARPESAGNPCLDLGEVKFAYEA